MTAPCPVCHAPPAKLPEAWRAPGLPEAMCVCDVRAFRAEQEAAGLATTDGTEDEDRLAVLRACGEPLVWAPAMWKGYPDDLDPSHGTISFATWFCAWSMAAVVAWEECGFSLWRGSSVHPRLQVALVRARLDPEWREAGEAVKRLGGTTAWGDHLAAAGWPLGTLTLPKNRTWTPRTTPTA